MQNAAWIRVEAGTGCRLCRQTRSPRGPLGKVTQDMEQVSKPRVRPLYTHFSLSTEEGPGTTGAEERCPLKGDQAAPPHTGCGDGWASVLYSIPHTRLLPSSRTRPGPAPRVAAPAPSAGMLGREAAGPRLGVPPSTALGRGLGVHRLPPARTPCPPPGAVPAPLLHSLTAASAPPFNWTERCGGQSTGASRPLTWKTG